MAELIGVLAAGARAPEAQPPAFDTTVPHASRMYDYLLGGKDNFAADREAAEQLVAINPATRWAGHAEVSRFFDGRDVLPPGLVSQNRWRPDRPAQDDEPDVSCYGAVGRKPG
jgi:hypothetical protein